MDVDLMNMVRDSRCISIQLSSRGDKQLAREGLTGVQARVLLYIMERESDGASLTQIHKELNFSMAAASGLIKRLREKGYVRVEPCRLDERRKLIYVTDKGARVREIMDSTLRRIPDMLYRGFSAEEIETLNRLQKKMLHNLTLPET